MKPEFVNEVPPIRTKQRQAPEPEWAKALIARPHEWAVIERFGPDKTKANAMQARLTQEYWKWQEKYSGRWEASYRLNEQRNGYEVYARYIP